MPTVREILESLHESGDEENCEPVQFQRGETIRGALCLWHQGFRFLKIRKDGSWFRCEQRNCPATAKLEDNDLMTGILGPKSHHHGCAPSRYDAETKRNLMKRMVKEEPKKKPSQLRAQTRTDVDDEVFELLGTNEALDRMTNRAKNKFVGKINCTDPLKIQIPPGLLIKNGESVLIYDSRGLLSVLKQNRRWSLDGTFRSAPKPWMQVFVIGCYVNNRMVVAAQALLPGKASKYYIEVLQQLKRAIEPVLPIKGNKNTVNTLSLIIDLVMTDFENGMLKAMRHVFPLCERSGCNFHMAQAVFRKARSMGIFNLLNEDDDEGPVQRKSVHKTFRSVLSLALIPPLYVRRAFSTIVSAAPLGVQGWLAYFAKTYIGTTQFEIDRGAEAFEPHVDVGHFLLRRTRSTTPFSVSQASIMTGSGPIQFGLHSPQPSTPTIPLSEESSLQLIRRWEHDIVRPPRFPISFWNVHIRVQMALERTNNGMEAAHGQFARELNHHPSLSDFITAFTRDIDKQLDIGRAEQLQKCTKRRQRYIIKEQNVVRILDEADFESEEGLANSLHLLGLVMQGFVEGLHIRGNEESDEETDDADGN
ncbi:hypothetical protein niasHT_011604 [Heterodera trifolii]|uniref:MULE transposase domain-containing protein n=1 Tax=Heterodera trifolii TaxID=157864 RepID=A0ABD2LIH4_9BILA